VDAVSVLDLFAVYVLIILIPLLVLYIVYLIITKAFHEMGFTSGEAIIIVVVSFLLGSGIADGFLGIKFSDIELFTYNTYWHVGVNVGGAIIPLILSLYLSVKNRLRVKPIFVGIVVVSLVTYLVTYPDPERGIVSNFPLWLLPIVCASILSVAFYWSEKKKAAPLAYVIGTLGVLIGADVLHLFGLLQYKLSEPGNAVIGGANVFDMVFITGLLAVFIDGLLLYQGKRKRDSDRRPE
jgi:uncharacterized membrane protein